MDMDEVFPVLAGVVVGLAIHHITSTRLRILIVAASSQVFVAASLTAVLAAFWRRRAWRLRS
jgi:hypothetical protein